MRKKQRYDSLYMDIALRVSKMSYARRLEVGAVILTKDDAMLYGWNGMPAGWDNNCEYHLEDGSLKTNPEVLHAERNALDKLTRCNMSGLGSTMYITHAPCLECAKSIYGSGISQVFYNVDYRSEDGIHFLRKCGVSIEKLIIGNK
jgi:dCMP deaminase